MSYLINLNYIDWLRRVSLHSNDNAMRSMVPYLIAGFKQSNSISDMLTTIQKYSKHNGDVYGSVFLHAKLGEWTNDLEQLKNNFESTKQRFTQIKKTEDHPLVELITDFLNDPKKQLHVDSPDLLKLLNDDDSHQVIQFIITLKQIPTPHWTPVFKEIPRWALPNPQKAACIDLLYNLSHHPDKESILYIKARKLLHLLSQIHSEYLEDLQSLESDDDMEEITLDSSEDLPIQEISSVNEEEEEESNLEKKHCLVM